VLEWKTPPAAESPGAEDLIAEMPELELPSIDAEPVPDSQKKAIPPSSSQEITKSTEPSATDPTKSADATA
jgi:hypothetical protein